MIVHALIEQDTSKNIQTTKTKTKTKENKKIGSTIRPSSERNEDIHIRSIWKVMIVHALVEHDTYKKM